MHIIYVVRTYPSSTETFVRAEVECLRALGHHVRILTWANGVSSCPKLFIAATRNAARNPFAYFDLVRYLRKLGNSWRRACGAGVIAMSIPLTPADAPDAVHAHFASLPTDIALAIGRYLERPVTATFHATDYIPRLGSRSLGLRIQELDRVIVVSHRAAAAVQKHHGPGVPISVVRATSLLPEMTEHRNDRTGNASVCSVGRLVPKKGHETLLRAWAIVQAQVPGAVLTIVGEGPLKASLERMVTDLQVRPDSVRLLGAKSHHETLRLIFGATVFALACTTDANGDTDGLPVAVVEALRLGRPVVTTEIAGLTEAVFNGVNGILVPQDDETLFAEALIRVLNRQVVFDRDQMQRRAELEFGPSRQVDSLLEIWVKFSAS